MNETDIKKEKIMATFGALRKIFSFDHFISYCENNSEGKYICEFLTSQSTELSFELKLVLLLEEVSIQENQQSYFLFINYCQQQMKGFQSVIDELDENEYFTTENNQNWNDLNSTKKSSYSQSPDYPPRYEKEITLDKVKVMIENKNEFQLKSSTGYENITTPQTRTNQSKKSDFLNLKQSILPGIVATPGTVPTDVSKVTEVNTKVRMQEKYEPYQYCDIPSWNFLLGSKMKHGKDDCQLVWTGKRGDKYYCIVDFCKPIAGGTDGVFDDQRLYHGQFDNSCKLLSTNELEIVTETRLPQSVISCNIDEEENLLKINHLGCSIQVRLSEKIMPARLCWCGTIDGKKYAVVEMTSEVRLRSSQWNRVYNSSKNQDKFGLLSIEAIVHSNCNKKSQPAEVGSTSTFVASVEPMKNRQAMKLPKEPPNVSPLTRSVTLPARTQNQKKSIDNDEYCLPDE